MLRLLMVTDVKLSLQNRSHDAMGGRFGLLARGLRSGDTNCAGPDKRHPNRKRRHDELLMLRGMIASIAGRFANFSWRLVSCLE